MERVAFVMHVREGEEEEYRRRHREVWPAVLAALKIYLTLGWVPLLYMPDMEGRRRTVCDRIG